MSDERLMDFIDRFGGWQGVAKWREFHPDDPVDLSKATLDKVNFAYCDLSGANFRDSYLADASFYGCDLTYADFRGADLDGANFQWTNLSGAKIRYESVECANFTGCVGLVFTPYELFEDKVV